MFLSSKFEYTPIKTDNAVSLFIQAIIYMLKIDGKCAVVLPDGQDLFSKSNKTLVSIREYLMKTCDLKEIIYLPSGIFTYTFIKTCIFYFIKKKEGCDVLETKIKISKTQKEIGRDYNFLKTHQTTNVKFYDYNPFENVKNLLTEVPIENIANNSYSLNYAEYIKEEYEDKYDDSIIVKTLSEVCEIQNGKRIVKGQVETGEYPVLGGGGFTSFYTNEYSREGKTCKISREGMSLHNCVMLLNEKYYLNDNIMINEYLWYYLDNNKEQVFKCGRGTAQKAIDIDEFKSIKIPIPSIEYQQEIIKYLDFIYEKTNKTSNEKIAELKQLNEFCLNNQKMYGDNKNKKLGDLCDFIKTGKNKPTDNKTGTLYPYYGTGSITGYTNEYLYDGYYILTARNGTIGNCFLTEGKFFPSDHIFVIDIKDKCLMKYVYYILSNNDKLDKLKTGIGIPNITKGILENLIIPVPSQEKQKEIVEYCENNNILIKQLEKEIENNIKQAQLFMSSIVKAKEQEQEQDINTD